LSKFRKRFVLATGTGAVGLV